MSAKAKPAELPAPDEHEPAKKGYKLIDLNRPRGLDDVRRENLRNVVDRFGAKTVAEKLGLKSQRFISQMVGKHPSREVTEKTVRLCERVFNLPIGSLDHDKTGVVQSPFAAPQPVNKMAEPFALSPLDPEILSATMMTIDTCMRETGVVLSHVKYVELVSLVFADSQVSGSTPRHSYVRQLLRLLK